MCKKLPVDGFKWIDNLSTFNENSMKNYNETSAIGYFFEVNIEYPKVLFKNIKTYHFYLIQKK